MYLRPQNLNSWIIKFFSSSIFSAYVCITSCLPMVFYLHNCMLKKQCTVNTSSNHRFLCSGWVDWPAAARVEPATFLAAALSADGAVALTWRHVQCPLPPSAGAATRPRRGRWRQRRRWRGRGREAGGRKWWRRRWWRRRKSWGSFGPEWKRARA